MFTSFNLADKYRIPVIVLGDGMLGQMMEPVNLKSDTTPQKFKKPWALTGCRGRKPNIVKSFYMREGDLEKFNLKLQDKYNKIKKEEQRFEGFFLDEASIILVAYGSMSRIAKAAVKSLRSRGKKIGLIRPISLWPPVDVFKRLSAGKRGVHFCRNVHGQMVEDGVCCREGSGLSF